MSFLIESTPRQDGFRMPAEFEPHTGCWMLWPERPDNWRLGAKPAQKAFTAVATAIARFERVTMGVSAGQFQNARQMLPGHVRVVELSYNDSWMRDCGPTFVTNGEVIRAVDWDFNAWGGLDGGLYFPWDLDDLVARKVAEIEWVDRYKAPLVLEGGSIHVDGQGTLLTTEECLLNPNRNPQLSKSEIENLLMEYLNVEKILWLGKGVYNDETSGHVDNLACFI
ncbi:MAG TPA: agmatine deiminase, partial [Anaerolineaceae bacterium]|nr:agmatine deiminase [Anaerolineaceae bacterium]